MRFSPNGAAKFEHFDLLSWTHEILKVTKYNRKIKFDQIWEFQNGSSLQTGTPNSNFLTIHARRMKFSGIGGQVNAKR